MLIPDPPPPLFGAFARTRRGIESLPPDGRAGWWIDRDAGLAIFRPECVIEGNPGQGVLAIRGSMITAPPSIDPPAGWPAIPAHDAATSYAYDLLDRDVAAVDAYRGQFALALWDGRRRRLLLARDHLGQRAIFLRTEPDRILFCSELEPLLRIPGVTNELDAESAFWFLAVGIAPPGRTLARGIDRLPAAHALVWEPGKPPLLQRYWTPLRPDAPRQATPEVLDEIRSALDLAIVRRLSASNTTGVFLSGGVDSTYVSTTAVAAGAPPQHAFIAEFEPRYGMNETEYGAAVAGYLGVPLEVVSLDGNTAADILETVVLEAAQPAAAWAAITHVQILTRARQLGVETMFSGLGADEIFGGYDHFRGFQARYLRHLSRNPAPEGVDGFQSLLLAESQSSRRVLYPGIARFFDESALRRGLERPFCDWQYASHLRAFYRECRRMKPEAELMEMMVAHECQHRIPDMLFADFETMSRRMGVDVRYPFLDPDVITRVAGLAVESRYRTRAGTFSVRLRDLMPGFKYAMLQLAADRVPMAIINRPRKSFTAPFGGWLSEPAFSGRVLDALRRSRFWDVGIVKPAWVTHILERVGTNPSPWLFQLWALVALTGWYDRYVDRT